MDTQLIFPLLVAVICIIIIGLVFRTKSNESKPGPTEQTAAMTNAVKDPAPRYVIKCKANIRTPKFYDELSRESMLKSIITNNSVQNETIFGSDFEIYDKDKGFKTVSYLLRGIKNHYISALHASFMDHLPFQLRPDDIWILIGQGIANHIHLNAEKLRDKFVDFDGKKEIVVRDDRLDINSTTNDWSYVLEQFVAGCKKLTNNDIVDVITSNFSTTSKISQTASQCVLFKALSEYISFRTMTKSGIPQITLIGSVEDWKKIKAKCQEIEKMDIGLDFWLKYLYDIIDNIIKTVTILSNGQKELNGQELNDEKLDYFWNSIYNFKNTSGGSSISGWSKTLFPYITLSDGSLEKNDELKWDYSDDKYGEWAHISPGSFPASYSRCPMIWEYFNKEFKCGMYGGIFGIAQQKETGCIAPVIGWMIAGK